MLLEDAPNYAALSYTWGTHAPSILIWCNQSTVPISRPLYRALVCLRDIENRQNEYASRLCVYQICIYQDKAAIQEKNQQVSIMGEIYSRAATMFIWLGEESDSIGLAFDFLPTIAPDLAPITDVARIPQVIRMLPTAPAPEWEAVASLLHGPWLSRIWVLQEVAVSRDSILFAGRCSLAWIDFSRALTALENARAAYKLLMSRTDP